MANTLKRLYKGTLTITSSILYTAPSATKTIVKELVICNKTGSNSTVTIAFDDSNVVFNKAIPANDTLVIELHSIIEADRTITALAGNSGAIDIYISGIEVN